MVEPRAVDRIGRALLFVIVACFVFVLTHHALRPMKGLEMRVAALTQGIQLLTTAEAGMEKLDEQIDRATEAITESETVLPPQPEIERFLARLGQLAEDSGVEVESLTPGEIAARGLYHELRMRVRITGSYPAVQHFVVTLEETERLTRIEQLQIVGTSPGMPCAGDLNLALFFASTEGRG